MNMRTNLIVPLIVILVFTSSCITTNSPITATSSGSDSSPSNSIVVGDSQI